MYVIIIKTLEKCFFCIFDVFLQKGKNGKNGYLHKNGTLTILTILVHFWPFVYLHIYYTYWEE